MIPEVFIYDYNKKKTYSYDEGLQKTTSSLVWYKYRPICDRCSKEFDSYVISSKKPNLTNPDFCGECISKLLEISYNRARCPKCGIKPEIKKENNCYKISCCGITVLSDKILERETNEREQVIKRWNNL